MSALYTQRLLPTAITATSAAPGFPATNALLQALGAPWRSANTTQQDMVIDLGIASLVRGIGITDINVGSVVIASSSDNITFTDRATLTLWADRFERRRAIAALNTTARYWRIRIAAGVPTDGLAWWRIGCIYLFGAVADIVNPQYGARVQTNHAESRERVANGRTAVAALGQRFDIVSGNYGVQTISVMTIGSLLQALRLGPCWLNLDLVSRPWWSWPLIANAEVDEESTPEKSPIYTEIKLDAREVVA